MIQRICDNHESLMESLFVILLASLWIDPISSYRGEPFLLEASQPEESLKWTDQVNSLSHWLNIEQQDSDADRKISSSSSSHSSQFERNPDAPMLTDRTLQAATATCQLVKVIHIIQKPGCLAKAIPSFACSGTCPSYVQVSQSKLWQHERSCSCCEQTGLQEDTHVLDCPSLDPPYREVKTNAPMDCLCRSCSDLSREKLQPQELVEALESRN